MTRHARSPSSPQPTPTAATRLRDAGKAALDQALPDLRDYALVDFPHHENVGDSAIWLGEMDYFLGRGSRPRYVCSMNSISWQDLDKEADRGPIFLHGGGNFGDLWPSFQRFREDVLRRYIGHPVVQLPQTIHFEAADALAETAAAIRRHGALTLFVRDQPSLETASQHFDCKTILCPDMAFHIRALPGRRQPVHDVLLHLREDKESALSGGVCPLPLDGLRADWPHDPEQIEDRVMARTKLSLLLSGRAFPPRRQVARVELYRQLAAYRLRRGIALLTSARHVVTDRLHGHILCTMLDLPHDVLDNSYGKIGAFIQAWSTDANSSLRSFRRC